MDNLYDIIRSSLFFNKFEVGDLIFVEYTCPLEDESAGIWSHTDYIVHVLSGKKTWKTTDGSWSISRGQTIYVKKGASIVNQFFDDDFCMLGFFINDEFITEIVKEIRNELATKVDGIATTSGALKLKMTCLWNYIFNRCYLTLEAKNNRQTLF